MVIDRNARNVAANAVRRFYQGITTNDEFDGEYPNPRSTSDESIKAIATMVWNYYDDHRVHTLGDLSKKDRALFERSLAFLQSDHEYGWSESDFMRSGPPHPLLNMLTLGWARRHWQRLDDAFMANLAAGGDLSAWPFRTDQYHDIGAKDG